MTGVCVLGGWNNSPSAGQFHEIFLRPMVQCGVSLAAQVVTVSQSALRRQLLQPQKKLKSFHPLSLTSVLLCVTIAYQPSLMALWTMPLSVSQGLSFTKVLQKLSCDVCRV